MPEKPKFKGYLCHDRNSSQTSRLRWHFCFRAQPRACQLLEASLPPVGKQVLRTFNDSSAAASAASADDDDDDDEEEEEEEDDNDDHEEEEEEEEEKES